MDRNSDLAKRVSLCDVVEVETSRNANWQRSHSSPTIRSPTPKEAALPYTKHRQ